MEKRITINLDKVPKATEAQKRQGKMVLSLISEKDVPVKWSEEEIEAFHRRLKEDGLE